MKFLSSTILAIATILFILAIPLAIISTNVRMMALDPSFYEKGQFKFGAMQTIGLQPPQIQGSSRALASYFASADTSLASELQKQGLSSAFFNERETIHLKDVKNIIVRFGELQQLALGFGLLFIIANLALWRRGMLRRLGKGFLWGGGITLLTLALFGALSLTDFSSLFLTFHLVSFSNDLWILDPKTDYLIRMFPSQFFFEASITMATNAALQAVGSVVIGSGLFAVSRRGAR